MRENFFFGCRTRFSPTNLPEPLHAVVGADMSSFRARDCRPCGTVSTWKQAVTQLFLRNVLPANHQKDGPSGWGSIQTNNILAFPPFYYQEGPPCKTSTGRSFLNHNFPLLYLSSPYLHCSSSTFIATRKNSKWWLCSKRMSVDHGPKC
jgi:hypothetical protein